MEDNQSSRVKSSHSSNSGSPRRQQNCNDSTAMRIGDYFCRTDIRRVRTDETQQGFETSFLVIGQSPTNSSTGSRFGHQLDSIGENGKGSTDEDDSSSQRSDNSKEQERNGVKDDYDEESGGSDDGDDLSESSGKWKSKRWLCRPYKRERLFDEIEQANANGTHEAVLNTLKNQGIMIFIIDGKVSTTTADIMDSIRNIIRHIAKEEGARRRNESISLEWNDNKKVGFEASRQSYFTPNFYREQQRCLLYRDGEGRYFNLTLADHAAAAAGTWEGLLNSFSALQAVSIFTVLSRSFACIHQLETITDEFRPAYLALLLGLVFSEEISLSWTNAAMFVRGLPSISAYAVTSKVESDWLRKILLISLAMASAASGTTQTVMTLFGIGLTCIVLLANLGSRAWGYMRWRPLVVGWGPFEAVIAYVAAILMGLFVPYLGHRQVTFGGKVAMESIIRISFLVAAVFVVSDFDDIQKFLVVGSENCDQKYVNFVIGSWWTLSLVLSLFVVYKKEQEGQWPDDDEPLLEKDHTSPVGYKVPYLPEFPIDPVAGGRGVQGVKIELEFAFGILMAVIIGGGVCFLSITTVDDQFTSTSDNIFAQ